MSTTLVELPTELFQNVMSHYVNAVGVNAAWKSRAVCKTFATFITAEVFGGQPLEAFARTRGRGRMKAGRLLGVGLSLYLQYRSVVPRGPHPVLPQLVHDVHSKIVSVTGATSDEESWELRKGVAQAVDRYCADALDRITGKSRPRTDVAKDSIKEVALCVAIAMQRRDIIDALITDSASVWHKTYTFRMPIQLAAQMQDIDMVKLVLGYMGKMDNGVTMKERVKVLSKAITEYAKMRLPFYTDEEDESEKKEITALLIRWHIENLSKPSMDARTTFFEWCLDHADTSLLEVLLSIPTDKKVKDRYRWTYFQNVPSAAITKVLINKGIFDVTGVYNDLPRPPSPRRFWCTALDVVLGSVTVLNHAVYFGNEETVQMVLEMLDSGDRTNMSSALKGTLQLATSESNPTSETMLNIVAMLLKKGADPTAEDATHALANAAKQNDEEMVKLLLDHGADPRESWALYEAVKWQSVYMVKLLLKHGAKADGEPWPIHEAIKSKNQAIVADLLKFGANPNGEGWALAQAVQMNHRKFATMLLKAGADPNGDRWPLRCAIDESNFEMVKLLLEHGADPESGSDGDNDCTLALTYPRDNRNPIWLALVGAIKNKMDILGKDYQLIENAYAYYRWAPYEIFSRMSGTAMPREGYDGLIALDTASRSASPQSSVESESGPRRRGGSSERSRVRKRADYEADDDIDSIMLGIPREIRRVRRRRH